MQLLSVLPHYGEALLRLFYPSLCAVCTQMLELEENELCTSCQGQIGKTKLAPSEERIRIPFSEGEEGWALYRYEGAVKEVLHQIKFGRRRRLLQVFRKEFGPFLARRLKLTSYDHLISIPMDPRRRLEREFNQSDLLAKEMDCQFRISGISGPRLLRGGLFKRHSTPPQSLLGRVGRTLNLHRAFWIPFPSRIRGRAILLVDDIFTTGATFEEAAKTLKAAGASRVGYLALARAFLN